MAIEEKKIKKNIFKKNVLSDLNSIANHTQKSSSCVCGVYASVRILDRELARSNHFYVILTIHSMLLPFLLFEQ